MTTPFHTGVSLNGFYFEQFMLTVKLAAGIVAADVGKAVSLVAGTANTYELSPDDGIIAGRLEIVEARTIEGTLIGTVAFKFSGLLPVKAAATCTVGQKAVGAGAGEIKGATADGTRSVVERIGQTAVVLFI